MYQTHPVSAQSVFSIFNLPLAAVAGSFAPAELFDVDLSPSSHNNIQREIPKRNIKIRPFAGALSSAYVNRENGVAKTM